MVSILKKYLYLLATDRRNNFLDRLIKIFLSFLSAIYYLVISLISFGYKVGIFKVYKFECIVISVGNISWGGTGKTPLVEMLVRKLIDSKKKVAVLIRGYGQDESYMLSANLPTIPILVGKNRVRNTEEAIDKYGIDTFILDDGFQYRRIGRNLDIVTIDSTNPFGNNRVLPLGILREPISSLNRAQIFFLTKVDAINDGSKLRIIEERLKKINPYALIVESVHKPIYLYDFRNKEKIELSAIKDEKVCLVSSIEDPNYFRLIVCGLETEISLKFFFPDHYNYRSKDIRRIVNTCIEHSIKTIITTEKDVVKIKKTFHIPEDIRILVLRIELKITKNEEIFFNRLAALYSS